MAAFKRLLIISDPHYAGPLESQRVGHEMRTISNPAVRLCLRFYRRFFWLCDPYHQNHLLLRALRHPEPMEGLIGVGDYTLDTGFVGVADDGALESARACLNLMHQHYPGRCQAVLGDHDLGKKSMVGGVGGMRLASWRRAQSELNLGAGWRWDIGCYRLIGISSSLLALPGLDREILDEERSDWRDVHSQFLAQIRVLFRDLSPHQRVILFCHDPSSLPFLLRESWFVSGPLNHLDTTIIGHLHSPFIWWLSGRLSGMPAVKFLGHTIRKLSDALNQAKDWTSFRIRLCPALTGIELFRDGGYRILELDPTGKRPLRWISHRLARRADTPFQ